MSPELLLLLALPVCLLPPAVHAGGAQLGLAGGDPGSSLAIKLQHDNATPVTAGQTSVSMTRIV